MGAELVVLDGDVDEIEWDEPVPFGTWSGEGWDWLPADPFRAHLRLLSAASGVSWPVLAVLAQVSVPAIRGLLVGHPGVRRPARRVCPEVAERILHLDQARVELARCRQVPAARAVARLTALAACGSPIELAVRLGVTRAAFAALLGPVPPLRCRELTAAAVEAAYRQAWVHRTRPTVRTTLLPARAA